MNTLHRLCPVAIVPPGAMKQFTVEGEVILVANIDGKVFAVSALCTHENAALEDGYLEDCAVVCPIHFSMFSLATGAVLEGPATRPLRVFPVEIADGWILVTMNNQGNEKPPRT